MEPRTQASAHMGLACRVPRLNEISEIPMHIFEQLVKVQMSLILFVFAFSILNWAEMNHVGGEGVHQYLFDTMIVGFVAFFIVAIFTPRVPK